MDIEVDLSTLPWPPDVHAPFPDKELGTHLNCALGRAMSLFGLLRELYSVFQYAYQFVTHFNGRVGRVWGLCASGI